MDEFRALRAQVWGISVDSHWSHAAWRAQLQLPEDLLLLSDFNREFAELYELAFTSPTGAKNVLRRAVFVVDRDGTITYRWDVPDPPSLPKADDVLAAFRQQTANDP